MLDDTFGKIRLLPAQIYNRRSTCLQVYFDLRGLFLKLKPKTPTTLAATAHSFESCASSYGQSSGEVVNLVPLEVLLKGLTIKMPWGGDIEQKACSARRHFQLKTFHFYKKVLLIIQRQKEIIFGEGFFLPIDRPSYVLNQVCLH